MNQEEYDPIIQVVDSLPSQIGAALDAIGIRTPPSTGSTGATDLQLFGRDEAAETLQSQARLLQELSGDHLFAIPRLLSPPAMPFASFTCSRAILESSSQLLWLLDPTVASSVRISRSMHLRFRGLEQELRLVQGEGAREAQSDSQLHQARIVQRIEVVAKQAEGRGISTDRSPEGSIRSIGQRMPDATSLARRYLDAERFYRIFSGVAHGQSSFVLRVGFTPLDRGAFEKSLNPQTALMLLVRSGLWFARMSWEYMLYNGWSPSAFTNILETTFTTLRLGEREMFWRSVQSDD